MTLRQAQGHSEVYRTMKKMLLVFAHPDDESFSAGGTIAKYAARGWDIDLLLATRGEGGQSGEYGEISEGELSDIRQKEAQRAGAILGISSITFLEYKDGTLKDINPGELEDVVYKKMIELVPDVVITFDTTGISNHPDHVRMCYVATFAFQKYAAWIHEKLADTPGFREEYEPKLYYSCMPASVAGYLKRQEIVPLESYGKPWRGTLDKCITTVVNIASTRATKKKALMAYVSQRADVDRFLSHAANPLVAQEYFILRFHGIREVFMGKGDRVASRL
jgi:LmbE family N-acetylglucosaminyl deacetylase